MPSPVASVRRVATSSPSSSGSISSAVTAIECGSSSRAIAQQLLAQQLGGEERLGLVGDDAVGVVVRALGQPGLELADAARRRPSPVRAESGTNASNSPSSADAIARCSATSSRPRDVDLVHHEDRRRRAPAATRSATNRSPRPIGAVASTSKHTTSTSPSVDRARARCVRSPSSVRGLWMPGVSRNTICVSCGGAHAADLACASSAAGRRRSTTLRADELVHERRLPDVGPADERDEPGAERHDADASVDRRRRSSARRVVGGSSTRDQHRHDAPALHPLRAQNSRPSNRDGLALARARGRAG